MKGCQFGCILGGYDGVTCHSVRTLKTTAVDSPMIKWSTKGTAMFYVTSELSGRTALRTDSGATYYLEVHRPPVSYHGNCSGADDVPNASKPCFLDRKIGQITSSDVYFYIVLPCYHTIVVVQ